MEESQPAQERGPRAPGRKNDSGSRESGRAASSQRAQICRVLRFLISKEVSGGQPQRRQSYVCARWIY